MLGKATNSCTRFSQVRPGSGLSVVAGLHTRAQVLAKDVEIHVAYFLLCAYRVGAASGRAAQQAVCLRRHRPVGHDECAGCACALQEGGAMCAAMFAARRGQDRWCSR